MASPQRRIVVADQEAAFRAAAKDSIIGSDLILEHLHPNARGYFLLAKEYARAMRRAELFATAAEWAVHDTLTDDAITATSPLTEIDLRAARRRTEILTSGWPFTRGVAAPTVPPNLTGIDDIVERLVGGTMTWEEAHVEAARAYAQMGDVTRAAGEYRAIIGQLPLNVSPYIALAQLYIRADSLAPAGEALRHSLEVEKTGYALRVLGSMSLNAGKPADAVALLKDAVAIDVATPDYPETAFLLALAYARDNQASVAIAQLEALLQRDPAFTKAAALLRTLQRRK